MTKSFYLTSPIYYVNAKPHVGHAYTNVLCDTLARYHRMLGEPVCFLTGTDEHGTKVEKAAVAAGKTPQAYVDELVPHFEGLWRTLGITNDFFIRTTAERHKKYVQGVLADLEAKGEIYKASYKGWYCTPCESFWTELQLKDGKCPDCSRAVDRLEEENYFFKLAHHQAWLAEYIEKHEDFIRPAHRRNEVLGFLRHEILEDLCITRPKARLRWGIDYPNSKDHVVYVWFDALLNYVSAPQFAIPGKPETDFWPADVQLLGKDIVRQHAIYWPIMLRAMGLPMPKTLLVHGWWKIGEAKMSKSLGNVVDPTALAAKYGVDALRYFLLKEVTVGMDGTFSEDLLADRYNSDLANDLGNLWHRVASMIDKYFEGKIPQSSGDALKLPLAQGALKLWDEVHGLMRACDMRESLARMWSVISSSNQFVEEKKPWALAKDPAKKQELADTLYVLAECVAHLGVLLQTFMPGTAKKIMERLKVSGYQSIRTAEHYMKPLLTAGTMIEKGDPLFPRFEEKTP